jgi:hypothetical protein
METVVAVAFFSICVLWMYQVFIQSLKREYLSLRWKEFAYDKNKTRMAFDLIDAHLIHAVPNAVPVPQELPHVRYMRTDIYFDHSKTALGLYIIDAHTPGYAILYILPKHHYPHDKLRKDDELRRKTLEAIQNAITNGHIPTLKGKPYVYTENDSEESL